MNISHVEPISTLNKRGSRAPSAVSQVLRAMDEERACLPHVKAASMHGSPYAIRVANHPAQRERAYRLAHRVYSESGFVQPGGERCVSAYDMLPQTLTLLAEDAQGEAVATVTLVFDSPFRLPCDEIYTAELAALRLQGKRMAEVTRLAIAPEHTGCRMLLVQLFNYIYIHARKVCGATDFVIEVNPRHVAYYKRLLGFDVIGPERSCPRVAGAPAVLLGLCLSIPETAVRHMAEQAGNRDSESTRDRTLYGYFLHGPSEALVRDYLKSQHKPMQAEESRALCMALNDATAFVEPLQPSSAIA